MSFSDPNILDLLSLSDGNILDYGELHQTLASSLNNSQQNQLQEARRIGLAILKRQEQEQRARQVEKFRQQQAQIAAFQELQRVESQRAAQLKKAQQIGLAVLFKQQQREKEENERTLRMAFLQQQQQQQYEQENQKMQLAKTIGLAFLQQQQNSVPFDRIALDNSRHSTMETLGITPQPSKLDVSTII